MNKEQDRAAVRLTGSHQRGENSEEAVERATLFKGFPCCWLAGDAPTLGWQCQWYYLLGVHFVDGCVREAVVMEEAHLLAEQAVDDMSPRIVPLNKTHQLAVQRGAQIHGPVIAVQIHLQDGTERASNWYQIKKVQWAPATCVLCVLMSPTVLVISCIQEVLWKTWTLKCIIVCFK